VKADAAVTLDTRIRVFEESSIRKAVSKCGLNSRPVGLADAKAEDEAASRWADRAVAYGD
jgi:hypothetical protein